jgi:anti-anti-sigma factor
MEPSKIEYMHHGDVLVVNFLTERFELPEAEMLESIVFEKFAETSGKVVLNLSNAAYINSSAVSVIVRVAAEKNLRLADLKPEMVKILDMIGIFELLKTYPDIHTAVESFKKE